MHIVDRDELHYTFQARSGSATTCFEKPLRVTLKKDDWLCEPVLWVKWFHLGAAGARSECKVVSVEAQPFADAVALDAPTMNLVCKYAGKYVKWLQGLDSDLSDVSKKDDMWEETRGFVADADPRKSFGKLSKMRAAPSFWGSRR